jgi:hypothetical protein
MSGKTGCATHDEFPFIQIRPGTGLRERDGTASPANRFSSSKEWKERTMHKLTLTAALGAAVTLAAPLVPAEAGVIKPAGIGAALDETPLVQPVHCRPGRPHHSSFRFPDGCDPPGHGRRGYYRSYGYYEPNYYPAYPYAYGYSPGVSLGFSFGGHRHRHW